ncbi:MAG: GreA/GreB family elongation factor [Deltaproteobacteria bacterium]
MLDVNALVAQLIQHYSAELARARGQELDAREAARSVATAAEKREDARTTIEYGSMATGQARRVKRIEAELTELRKFARQSIGPFSRKSPIGPGAVVDLATEDDQGASERTFVVLPVGAGTELTGPGGDGLISVLTPSSPIGKALLGKCVGDGVDVLVRGTWRSWTIEHVG